MRLFLYGTLLDAGTRARRGGTPRAYRRGKPARLHGWQRVTLRGTAFPTLRRVRTGVVYGTLLDVDAHCLARLAAWEGPEYRLRRVLVQAGGRRLSVRCWVAPAGTCRAWGGTDLRDETRTTSTRLQNSACMYAY